METHLSLKEKLRDIIFGTATRAGRLFDILLLWIILASILVIMLESVPTLNARYSRVFKILEWSFTLFFTVEYLLRIWVAKERRGYVFSFFGIVDFLAVVPAYLGLFLINYQMLIVLRAIRLLRVFRVFQLTKYLSESMAMGKAMFASLHKIIVFFSVVLVLVMILGTIMYVVEGGENGFTSIPESIYWAIVTITTVGYGDITPATVIGKFISSFIMLLGYAILAVPTGIVTAEFTKIQGRTGKEEEIKIAGTICSQCGDDIYDPFANFCRNCGAKFKKD